MRPPDFQASKPKETILYAETVSSEAYSLIENLTRVDIARRLVLDLGFIDFDKTKEASYALDKLASQLRREIREELLAKTPRKISETIIDRLRSEITKQLIGEKYE